MKTLKFEVEVDLTLDEDLVNKEITPDQQLEMACDIDNAIRKMEREFGILPKELQFGDTEVRLIRVKPLI